MLARQEEEQVEEVLSVEEENRRLRQAPKEPLFKTVLDTSTRSHCQILFLTMAVLAMLVTVGSGVSASRGYALVAVQQKADALEQENERLKIDIAKLKSPERIKNIAQDQLGMEVPKHTYFSQEK
ncbi:MULTISPECIES: cell division protein FtsL [Selenomonas]|uniref:Cell division protein FtsL n=1 Tax=Selenomonas ruminis TaxID=2593411 RepID=A0A5D6W5N2_9FIRM|nr:MULTISPECIES: cell division protein FtsL [unclassified Selenomonas]MBQ1867334.1 cell division protein FtsL [Selenomonas sp.]MCR5440004.1 cell division protein FtsL [Selenomonas sp.]TYZ23543.1 cell division protein FtsL [Selenomonas sp. mPRGC5]SDG38733.1 cell division protein FtsL [Selenomonas ruminantium]